MAFKVLKRDSGLVGIDFGTTGIKILQVTTGDNPQITRMGFLEFPLKERESFQSRLEFARKNLPRLISKLHLRGARSACSIPPSLTVIQHVKTSRAIGSELDALVREEFVKAVPCNLDAIVLRHLQIPPEQNRSPSQVESICMAVSRSNVMQLVRLQKECRLLPAAMHAEPLATIYAFDHITQRADDSEMTTLYLDVGGGLTKVVIAHGKELVFTKSIPVAGKQFDQKACEQVGGDIALAHKHRLAAGSVVRRSKSTGETRNPDSALQSEHALQYGNQAAGASLSEAAAGSDLQQKFRDTGAVSTMEQDRRRGILPPEMRSLDENSGRAVDPDDPLSIDLTDQLDILADEVSMCVRYHQSCFPQRRIDRAIFLGGESVSVDLCQHIARKLRLRAHLGDPLARLARHPHMITHGVEESRTYPGWAVPLGLCVGPTDI